MSNQQKFLSLERAIRVLISPYVNPQNTSKKKRKRNDSQQFFSNKNIDDRLPLDENIVNKLIELDQAIKDIESTTNNFLGKKGHISPGEGFILIVKKLIVFREDKDISDNKELIDKFDTILQKHLNVKANDVKNYFKDKNNQENPIHKELGYLEQENSFDIDKSFVSNIK